MTNVETYNILVFGGGKSGTPLAMDQATTGQRVAVVEEGMIGGACINISSIPTKTLVRSAQPAGLARRAEEFRSVRTGPDAVDMGRIAARTAAVAAGMVSIIVGPSGQAGSSSCSVGGATASRGLSRSRRRAARAA